MVLSKDKILERIKSGAVSFTPKLDRFQLKSHSLDLRMGYTFLVPRPWHMTKAGREALNLDYYNPKNLSYYQVIELEEGQFFDILPQEHVIVSTLESVKMPSDLMAVLFPRSSVNRRGLSVDMSGIIDAGYEGQLIIPITNNIHQAIRLYPGERFCYVVFEEITDGVKTERSRFHKRDVIQGVMPEKSATERNLIRLGNIKKLKSSYGI